MEGTRVAVNELITTATSQHAAFQILDARLARIEQALGLAEAAMKSQTNGGANGSKQTGNGGGV